MSYGESTSTTCPDVCVSERAEDQRNDCTVNSTKCVNSEGNSPDSSERERVLKEVGLTCSTFIGPALPPKPVKADIDDALSEFYKELGEVDTPDGADGNPGQRDEGSVYPPTLPKLSNTKDNEDVRQEKIGNSYITEEPDGYENIGGQKHSSWSHWYQNEPYNHRRPRQGFDRSFGGVSYAEIQKHHPQQWDRAPNPRFHRPLVHCPSPPPESRNPPYPLRNMNPKWNESDLSNHYLEDAHFPTLGGFPPPNVGFVPPQGFYGNSEQFFFDRDERRHGYYQQSENESVRWSRDTEAEWPQTQQYRSSFVLILMRGLPGSGKSTLARELLSTGPSGVILSTDDYFAHRDGYCYEPGLLGVAHEWNQRRAEDAMRDGRSPVIIDNTNIQAWEMKPYVEMALERGYKVDFCEPDTSWKLDPYELEKRNKHGVSKEKIARMLDSFSFPISIDIVMNSQEPPHVNQRRQPHQSQMMRTQVFY
ncbi:NEDD4-binding protein 2-like 2 [Betta splendens]|uniref:NEDD4-binding protein 2-like 2 n=1 Tax=Betta splendens TaxID=158456 RepID=A0A6P7P7Q6_BETSP|nr:NEDD4-binding protein 2-like 2 [Betta splendens]